MLGAEDPLESELEEQEVSEVTKHHAWLEASHKHTIASLENIQTAAGRFEQHQPNSSPHKADTALERYLLEKLLSEDERAHLARSRAEERDKHQMDQLRQLSALNQQRAVQSPAQQPQGAFRPPVSNPVVQQPLSQPVMWPAQGAGPLIPEANTSLAPASGFRSFSIMGKAKPPS